LFFFHNPKAGGSSLRVILTSMYGQDRSCPVDPEDPHLRKATADGFKAMRGFDLYMGHYGYDMYRAIDSGHAAITNFRHPAARLASLYNYFRFAVHPTPEELASSTFTAVRTAKSSSFEDFALSDDPRVAMYTCDHHFRQLANSPWSMATARSERDVSELIAAMPWFYVCEFPDASYLWARSALGWRLDKVRRDNITGAEGGESATILGMSDLLYARIMARNARDLAIYRLAVDRLIEATSHSLAVRPITAAA
jgi:hypothetical protein